MITVASLNALTTGVVVAPDAAANYNGFEVTVNLAKPVDYVAEIGKCIVNVGAADTSAIFNLRETSIYRLWISQGKPTAAVDVTQEQLNVVVPWIRIDMARTGIYKVANASNILIGVRRSDLATAGIVPIAARKERVVDEIVNAIANTNDEQTEYAQTGRFCLLCIVANAIHREQNEGHNWYTADTKKTRTPTGKACTIAGASAPEFRDFMALYGHDAFHHLTTTTLNHIASAVAGIGTATIGGGRLMWGGEDVNGLDLRSVFYVGEASMGRFPAGILGKAAIIICCNMAQAMLNHIMGRVLIRGADTVGPLVSGVSNAVKSADFTHAALLDMDSRLADVVSFTYGYVTGAMIVDADEYLAFKNHAERNAAMVAAGKSLAQSVLSARVHKGAVESAVTNAINSIAASFRTVAASTPPGSSRPIFPDHVDLDHDAEDVVAEVGEDQGDRLMNALLSGDLSRAMGGNGAAAAP